MRATVVPNRNALMLDLAVGLAITAGADAVAFGAHAGDHAIYADCRPEFLAACQQMAAIANDGFLPEGFTVTAPFLEASKAWIAGLAARLGVPVRGELLSEFAEALADTLGGAVSRQQDGVSGDAGRLAEVVVGELGLGEGDGVQGGVACPVCPAEVEREG
jgi:hypothetical protein